VQPRDGTEPVPHLLIERGDGRRPLSASGQSGDADQRSVFDKRLAYRLVLGALDEANRKWGDRGYRNRGSLLLDDLRFGNRPGPDGGDLGFVPRPCAEQAALQFIELVELEAQFDHLSAAVVERAGFHQTRSDLARERLPRELSQRLEVESGHQVVPQTRPEIALGLQGQIP
jgi:hypothetical protein